MEDEYNNGANSVNFRKLVIIGDGACGKTSLLSVFTLGYFPTVRRLHHPGELPPMLTVITAIRPHRLRKLRHRLAE